MLKINLAKTLDSVEWSFMIDACNTKDTMVILSSQSMLAFPLSLLLSMSMANLMVNFVP